MTNKKYWYNLSFSNGACIYNVYIGLHYRYVAQSTIKRCMKDDSYVLIDCSYLGKMTEEEFNDI